MQSKRPPAHGILTILPIFFALHPSLAILDCENIQADGHTFDLSELGGPRSILTSRYESIPDAYHNTTYTLDICKPLEKQWNVRDSDQCPDGTRVCATTRFLRGWTNSVGQVVPIAGSLEDVGASSFGYEATRLTTTGSKGHSLEEGLRLVLKGGKHPLDGPVKERRKQVAIIDFLCDPDKLGTENVWGLDEYRKDTELQSRADEKSDEVKGDDGSDDSDKEESTINHQVMGDDAAIIWKSHKHEEAADVLRLTWFTKFACLKRYGTENGDTAKTPHDDKGKGKKISGGKPSSNHWGFFTWAVLASIVTAILLAARSKLSNNWYSGREWSPIPYRDTGFNIIYLAKDWTSSALDKVKGLGKNKGDYIEL